MYGCAGFSVDPNTGDCLLKWGMTNRETNSQRKSAIQPEKDPDRSDRGN